MATEMNKMDAGLDGIIVAETALSEVDGERGNLLIAGKSVHELAMSQSYEAVAAALWDGHHPSSERESEVRRALGVARSQASSEVCKLGDALAHSDAMAALRTALSHLNSFDDAEDVYRITGALPVFAAAWMRASLGKAPIAANPELGHAEDYLRLLGFAPHAARTRALETYLITVSDHGMNASTFTARVVVSTGSDFVSAAVAAIGALKGPLHGGAPGPVLDMLDEIAKPECAEAWLDRELLAKRRIMGMGHRIYRVRDPRAEVLERALSELEQTGLGHERLVLARAVEKAAQHALAERYPTRPLKTNVEFYTAVLLDAIGLDRRLFSPTFAVGRALGWMAHAAEQRKASRLIRPASRYVGPRPVTVKQILA